jgi:hypothetical protein
LRSSSSATGSPARGWRRRTRCWRPSGGACSAMKGAVMNGSNGRPGEQSRIAAIYARVSSERQRQRPDDPESDRRAA